MPLADFKVPPAAPTREQQQEQQVEPQPLPTFQMVTRITLAPPPLKSMSLADAITAAQAAQQQLDPLLQPARDLFANLTWAKDQLGPLKTAADEEAQKFRDAVARAVEAVTAVGQIVAAWLDYLITCVGPLNAQLAGWVYDHKDKRQPFEWADTHIVNPAKEVRSSADDAGRATLDKILEGVETAKKNANELQDKKSDWDGKPWNHDVLGSELAYLVLEAAKMSVPWTPPDFHF